MLRYRARIPATLLVALLAAGWTVVPIPPAGQDAFVAHANPRRVAPQLVDRPALPAARLHLPRWSS
jgi:hypothetical protein